MKLISYLPVIIILMFCSLRISGQDIKGVWRTMKIEYNSEDTSFSYIAQPSIFIFTKKYYSRSYVLGAKERPMIPENTKFEDVSNKTLKETLGDFVSNSGTYELKDNRITFKFIVALWPNYMNHIQTSGYYFEKKMLVIQWGEKKNGKWPGKAYLKRLE